MDLRFIVAASVLCQFGVAILALRLVRITERRSAWWLIAAATSLMALRRCITLIQLSVGNSHTHLDLTSEVAGLATSVLLAVGVARIAPLFLSIQQSRKELREGRRVLKAILDASPIGIFLVRQRTIEWTNAALQRMLGYSEEALHRQSTKLIYPDSQEYKRVGMELYAQLERRGAGQVDTRLRRKDGSTFPSYFMVCPLEDDDPSQGYIVALTDLTDRQKLEEQIIHSQKMEAVGRLAGGIAHDFNNLLTSVLGYVEMLQMKLEEGSRLYDYASEIRKAGALAASLTRQLLTFSHKQVQDPKLLRIDSVVTDIHQMLKRLIGEDVELDIRLGSRGGHVRMDQGQIEQVIMNLAVNARDAMPHGGRLTIETCTAALGDDFAHTQLLLDPGTYGVMTVKDTGYGMDAETRAHIFEPFFTTKEKGKGTGLGLATTYAIVHQAGGAIEVQSQPGQGSAFTIYIPLVESPENETATCSEPPIDPRLSGNETILLVEDETAVRKLARETLEEDGYVVLVAGNGHEAMQISRSHKGLIHLMVTDVVMPRMSGDELAHCLSMKRPTMKVLFISGYAEEAIAHRGVLEPGVAFLPKPFTPAELARRVREILDAPVALDMTRCEVDRRVLQ